LDRQELLSAPVRVKVFPPTRLAAVVKGPDGKPLAGIDVQVVQFQGNTSSWSEMQTSDASGRVVFGTVYSGGMYRLEVNDANYNSFATKYPPPAVGSKGWSPHQEIKLTKADMAKGHVVDEQGKPVSGAEVQQVCMKQTNATTDANGDFRIALPAEDDLARDEHTGKPVAMLRVIHGGRDIGAVVTMNRAELLSKGITITVHPARTLTVAIKDTEGKPIRGVGVEAFLSFGYAGTWASTMLHTDDAGEVVIPSVYFGGVYDFMTELAGYYRPGDAKSGPVGSEKWKDRIEFVMERADRTQKGTVVDEAGKPVAGATVKSYVSDDSHVTTGPDGSFTLTGLPSSKVTLYASLDELRGSAEVSKDTPTVVIKLKKPKTK
jgi:hypothetical protein